MSSNTSFSPSFTPTSTSSIPSDNQSSKVKDCHSAPTALEVALSECPANVQQPDVVKWDIFHDGSCAGQMFLSRTYQNEGEDRLHTVITTRVEPVPLEGTSKVELAYLPVSGGDGGKSSIQMSNDLVSWISKAGTETRRVALLSPGDYWRFSEQEFTHPLPNDFVARSDVEHMEAKWIAVEGKFHEDRDGQ
nr:uncharacterized protein CI109_003906 [Kwoniella shandongensis]KAA5527647.1 hypothetical protein CI109_003906 [Kwoniella shandongensis]